MVSNDLVMPLLLRLKRFDPGTQGDLAEAAARDPPRCDRGDRAPGLRLLPVCGRGRRARRDWTDLVCGSGAVRARHAGRHLLEARYPRRRARRSRRGIHGVAVHLAAALLCALRVVAAELSRPGAVGSAAAASARAVRPGRAGPDHACDGVEHARQRLDVCGGVAARSSRLRHARSGGAIRRRRAGRDRATGAVAWPGLAAGPRGPAGPLSRRRAHPRGACGLCRATGRGQRRGARRRRRPGRVRRDPARRRDRLGLGASDGGLGRQGGSPGLEEVHEHPRRDLPSDRLQQGRSSRSRANSRRPPRSCAPPTSGCRSSTG